MGERGAVTEQIPLSHPLEGPDAVLLHVEDRIVGGLRAVGMPAGAFLTGKGHRVDHQLLVHVDDVEGRRPDTHPASRGPGRYAGPGDVHFLSVRVPEELARQTVLGGHLRQFPRHAPGDRSPDAHLLDGIGDGQGGYEIGGRVVVVQHCGDPRSGSFHRPDLGAYPSLVRGDGGRDGPHEVRQPRPQLETLPQAAQQVLKEVLMGVDQARKNRLAGGVDHPGGLVPGHRIRSTHRDDPVAGNRHRARIDDPAAVVHRDHRATGNEQIAGHGLGRDRTLLSCG